MCGNTNSKYFQDTAKMEDVFPSLAVCGYRNVFSEIIDFNLLEIVLLNW